MNKKDKYRNRRTSKDSYCFTTLLILFIHNVVESFQVKLRTIQVSEVPLLTIKRELCNSVKLLDAKR